MLVDDVPAELPDYVTTSREYLREELERALRNREMPLEALRYDVTPTGLHYLLTHFDVPDLDIARWQLTVDGAVDRRLALSLDELRVLPERSITVTMECAGNGRGLLHPRPIGQPWLNGAVSTAVWTGSPLWPLLERAGVSSDAVEVVFTGSDSALDDGAEMAFARSLRVDECRTSGALLAWGMNGGDLPPQHGAPIRLIVPGWYGMASVKWLTRVTVLREPFDGYFQAGAYRIFQAGADHAPPVTRMLPRALLTPPGIPDAETGGRAVRGGRVALTGRAWSGLAPITRVEVGFGDGSWRDARLHAPVGEHAWRGFRYDWEATEGSWEVSVRATDGAGNVQPLEAPWNLHGYRNNAVRPSRVTVFAASGRTGVSVGRSPSNRA